MRKMKRRVGGEMTEKRGLERMLNQLPILLNLGEENGGPLECRIRA